MTRTQKRTRRRRRPLRGPDRVGADRRRFRSIGSSAPRSSRATSGSPGRRCISRRRRPWRTISDVWIGATSVAAGGQTALSLQTPFLALRNSLILAFGATALAVLYGSVIAYGVSRYRLLSETRMFQLLMLRMVPPIVIVAPLSLYYLVYRPARFDVRARRAVLPQQPALRGVDDQELHRRGAARGRAGGRDPRRLALAHGVRGGPAADPLGAGGDLHVHPDPELERISAGADPVEDRGRDLAGRAVEIRGLDRRPAVRPSGGAVGRHHPAADRSSAS